MQMIERFRLNRDRVSFRTTKPLIELLGSDKILVHVSNSERITPNLGKLVENNSPKTTRQKY